jgi:hypothetical protein
VLIRSFPEDIGVLSGTGANYYGTRIDADPYRDFRVRWLLVELRYCFQDSKAGSAARSASFS